MQCWCNGSRYVKDGLIDRWKLPISWLIARGDVQAMSRRIDLRTHEIKMFLFWFLLSRKCPKSTPTQILAILRMPDNSDFLPRHHHHYHYHCCQSGWNVLASRCHGAFENLSHHGFLAFVGRWKGWIDGSTIFWKNLDRSCTFFWPLPYLAGFSHIVVRETTTCKYTSKFKIIEW